MPRQLGSRARAILMRDDNRCQVPGCTSRRKLDVHMIEPVPEGGRILDSNLITMCRRHIEILKEGHLRVSGSAHDAHWELGCSPGRPPLMRTIGNYVIDRQ